MDAVHNCHIQKVSLKVNKAFSKVDANAILAVNCRDAVIMLDLKIISLTEEGALSVSL